jgi:primosomal protein N' (replication factor Y)
MEEKSQKFIIDVAPIARLPLSRQQFFSYLHHAEIPTGSLVSIPLFRREVQGVVLGSRSEIDNITNYELKNISKVLVLNFLTENQLKLAEKISKHYITSLGVVLKHFLPKQVKSRTASNQSLVISHRKNPITLTPEQASAVSAIADSYLKFETCNWKFLLYGPASSGKTEVYIHAILKLRVENPEKQFLILLPELTLTPQALERYGAYFNRSEMLLLHSKLGQGEFFQAWQRIAAGQVKIIIATRTGIFAPFKDLGGIFVDEEQDMSFKQWDMNPRYDARTGAEQLAEIFSCPIVFGTATPRIESFQKTLTGEFKLLPLPVLPSEIMGREKTTAGIEIIDMRKEKWTDFAGKKKPNHSMLSMRLQEEISYALREKMQVILFVNHQGLNTFSVCSSCKAVLKCPKCERALVPDQDGTFKCLHCNFTDSIVPSCKACGSIIFQNIGIGTVGVEREVKKLFGNVRIGRLDSAAAKKAGATNEIFNNFSQGNIDILIGTQMITKGWDNPNVILVGIIDGDSLFSSPDYLTDERAHANIMQIAGRTGRVGSRYVGHVVLQTFNPNRKVFESVTNRDYATFFQKEIAARQALSYPPFGEIIKITFKDELEAKAAKEASAVHAKILKIIDEFDFIFITDPEKPLVSKIRGKAIMQMMIKIKTGTENASMPDPLFKLLGSLATGWSVDVDPISVA